MNFLKFQYQKQHLHKHIMDRLQQVSEYSRTFLSRYSSKTRIERIMAIIREPKATVPKW